jgi:hypothetical protein
MEVSGVPPADQRASGLKSGQSDRIRNFEKANIEY